MKKRMLLGFLLLCSVGFLLLPGVSPAETGKKDAGVYTLGEVVVSAEQEVVEAAGTSREITAEDIQNKDARTLDQALQLLPGVEIRTGAEGTPRVDIRAFRETYKKSRVMTGLIVYAGKDCYRLDNNTIALPWDTGMGAGPGNLV